MAQTEITATPDSHEIVVTRTFDAPLDLVYQVITDPQHIPHWWGPARYPAIVDQMDVRQGGVWRYVTRDTEGNEFNFHGIYHEIVPNERIVQTFEFEGMPGHVALETMRMEERDGKTILHGSSVFQSVADRNGMLQSGMEGGTRETTERLAALLERLRR